MLLYKNMSFWIACYVLVTGLVFLILPLAQTPWMVVKTPNRHFLTALSLVFCAVGARYARLAWKGRLESEGIDIKDVRKEALDRISDETYLARVAKEDPVPEIREKALQRLEEVAGNTGSSNP